MKGIFCGSRALALVAVVVLAVAAAPAIAKADVAVGGITSTVPSTPAVPAVPSAPPLAAPALPVATPTPAAPSGSVQVSTPAATFTAASSGSVLVSTPAATVTAAPGAVAVRIGSNDTNATGIVKQTAAKTSSTVAKKKAKASHKPVTANVKVTVNVGRSLLSGGNPAGGCVMLQYQLCQTIPDFAYLANNDCNNEQIPFVGTLTIWMNVTTNVWTQTITTHQRTFFIGFQGQGDQGNTYTGQDTQNDFSRQFALGPVVVDHRDYEVLIVTKQNPLDPAPNQFMYFRTVTRVDPLDPAHPQISIFGPFVVCQMHQKHSHDRCDSDKNDDDNDSNKHHHSEQYSGYNDSPNRWDD